MRQIRAHKFQQIMFDHIIMISVEVDPQYITEADAYQHRVERRSRYVLLLTMGTLINIV